jgi:hypothetical protein
MLFLSLMTEPEPLVLRARSVIDVEVGRSLENA